jgi:hypothetical protein
MPTRSTAGGAVQQSILTIPEGDQQLSADYDSWRESVVLAYRNWAKQNLPAMTASHSASPAGRIVESQELTEPAK